MKFKLSWPVAISLIYGLFFVVLVAIVIISMFSRRDLVSPDYYRKEINYQQQIDKEKRTGALDRKIDIQYSREQKKLFIIFPGDLNMIPESGTVVLFRPSDARQDKTIPLNVSERGFQTIDVSNFSAGNWRIKVEWSFEGQTFYHEVKMIL